MAALTRNSVVADEKRWEAVKLRGEESKYAFIYAVRTTGVYCRPTCSSRLPRRRNVEFFDTSVDGAIGRLPTLQAMQTSHPHVGGRPCSDRQKSMPEYRIP
jgi:hypothetical protein